MLEENVQFIKSELSVTFITSIDLSNTKMLQLNQYFLSDCPLAKKIKCPKSLKEIAPACFSNLKYLSLLDLSPCADIQVIPDRCCHRSGTSNGLSVYLSPGCLCINESAFEKSGLSSLHVPSTCKHLGNRAFANCRRLRQLEFAGTIPFFEDDVFKDTTCVLKSIAYPANIQRKLIPLTTKMLRPAWMNKILLMNRLSNVQEYRKDQFFRTRSAKPKTRDSEHCKERRNRRRGAFPPLPIEILEIIFFFTSEWPTRCDGPIYLPVAQTKLACDRQSRILWHSYQPKLWIDLEKMSVVELEMEFSSLGEKYIGRRSKYRTMWQIYYFKNGRKGYPLL